MNSVLGARSCTRSQRKGAQPKGTALEGEGEPGEVSKIRYVELCEEDRGGRRAEHKGKHHTPSESL